MLTLVSTVILVVMSGLLTAVKSSSLVATKRDLAGSLTIAAEDLQGASTAYVACGAPTDYPTPAGFVPDFPDVVFTVAVSYFDGAQYQTSCGTDQGAQLITITASRGGQTETAVVVKRDPANCEGC